MIQEVVRLPLAVDEELTIRKNRLGSGDKRFCVVTGVRTFDDMLNARVVAVSSAAIACGVEPGMPGREALLRMEQAQAAV